MYHSNAHNFRIGDWRKFALILLFFTSMVHYLTLSFLTYDHSLHVFLIFYGKDWAVTDHRFSMYLLQAVPVLISKLGGSAEQVKWAYGLAYSLIPFIAGLFVYLILKKSKFPLFEFFLMAISTLFVVNSHHLLSENLTAIYFLFPLLAAGKKYFEEQSRGALIGICILGLFITFLHPFSFLILLLVYFVKSFLGFDPKNKFHKYVGLLFIALMFVSILNFWSVGLERGESGFDEMRLFLQSLTLSIDSQSLSHGVYTWVLILSLVYSILFSRISGLIEVFLLATIFFLLLVGLLGDEDAILLMYSISSRHLFSILLAVVVLSLLWGAQKFTYRKAIYFLPLLLCFYVGLSSQVRKLEIGKLNTVFSNIEKADLSPKSCMGSQIIDGKGIGHWSLNFELAWFRGENKLNKCISWSNCMGSVKQNFVYLSDHQSFVINCMEKEQF